VLEVDDQFIGFGRLDVIRALTFSVEEG